MEAIECLNSVSDHLFPFDLFSISFRLTLSKRSTSSSGTQGMHDQERIHGRCRCPFTGRRIPIESIDSLQEIDRLYSTSIGRVCFKEIRKVYQSTEQEEERRSLDQRSCLLIAKRKTIDLSLEIVMCLSVSALDIDVGKKNVFDLYCDLSEESCSRSIDPIFQSMRQSCVPRVVFPYDDGFYEMNLFFDIVMIDIEER